MTILLYFLMFVEILCSLLLIGVVLLQKTKGQGVGLAFGAGMGESLFGAQMGNVLTKTTIVLGIIFLVNTTVLSLLQVRRATKSAVDAAPILPVATAPSASQGPPAGAGMPADVQPGSALEMPAVEATVPLGPIADTPTIPAVAEEEPAPATEAPATEAPATEAPAAEAPATEAPATEAPAPAE